MTGRDSLLVYLAIGCAFMVPAIRGYRLEPNYGAWPWYRLPLQLLAVLLLWWLVPIVLLVRWGRPILFFLRAPRTPNGELRVVRAKPRKVKRGRSIRRVNP